MFVREREREGIQYIERGSLSSVRVRREKRGWHRKFIRHSLGGNA